MGLGLMVGDRGMHLEPTGPFILWIPGRTDLMLCVKAKLYLNIFVRISAEPRDVPPRR